MRIGWTLVILPSVNKDISYGSLLKDATECLKETI